MDGNLRQQVVQQVRAEIISGQRAPGMMYSVPNLAESLGISTTPVREALLELTRSGLVEPMRNRGFKVVAPSVTELRNLFDLREVLEVYAATVVARKADKNLDGLRQLADDVANAVRDEDVRLYLETDRSFHRAFTAAAGNDLLTEMVMALRDKMRLYGITTRAGHERQQASVQEHYEIISLAAAGDVDRLTALLKPHIRSWEPIFVEAIERAEKESRREPLVPGGARP